MKQKKHGKTEEIVFYSKRGVITLAVFVAAFIILSLWGMTALGVIQLPAALTAWFAKDAPPVETAGVEEDIALLPQKQYETAVPLAEYAAALAGISLPQSFYQTYTLTRGAGKTADTQSYTYLQNGGDFWVQTARGNTILSTVVCKDGSVRLTDHTRNDKVALSADYSAEEAAGVLGLSHLLSMMAAAARGEEVDYGGGISNYSLSMTTARGEGDKLFTFAFTTADGISEQYTFSPERGVLLSGEKSYGKKVIYSMRSTGYTDDLSEINLDLFFAS